MNLHEIISTEQDPKLNQKLQKFIAKNIEEFKKVYHSYEGNYLGAISVAETFWLFYLIKSLKPRQIIESGTFYGYSLYFISKAVNWECDILSFDIDQSKSNFPKNVKRFEFDWTYHKNIKKGKDTLVFFDDHIDHDKRLLEAIDNDQQHILFHDNYLTTKHSHKPIRFCSLHDANLCYTFPPLYSDSIFTDTSKNIQTYRWLTYIERPTKEKT